MHKGHHPCSIPPQLRICHGKECVKTVSIRSSRTESNQGIHVGRPVDQASKAADKELLVDHHDCRSQHELYQPYRHMIFFKERRHRPVPHHVPHGEIHQRDQETQRCDQSPLHLRRFLIF